MKELNQLLETLKNDVACIGQELEDDGVIIWDDEWISCETGYINNQQGHRRIYYLMFHYIDDAFGMANQDDCFQLYLEEGQSQDLTQKEIESLRNQIKHKNAVAIIRLTFPNHYQNVYDKLLKLADSIKTCLQEKAHV